MAFILPRVASQGGGGYTPTLWVNAATGDDSRTKATVAASGGALPWATIGRAVWGSTNRAAPSSGQAAAAGDVVAVAAGSYNYAGVVSDRFVSVYNPVNAGSLGNPIIIQAMGAVVLSAPAALSPIIGASARNYITWTGQDGSASWNITAYGLVGGTAPAGTVWTTPDTGPVVIHDCTGSRVERASINGGAQTDFADNYNGIRVENATSFVIRNCTVTSFRQVSYDQHNGSCITIYGGLNGLIENCALSNAGSGVFFKDTASSNAQSGNIVRYCDISGVSEGLAFSLTQSFNNRNYLYQNLIRSVNFAIAIGAGGLANDWIYNNTIVTAALAGIITGTASWGTGRVWNNILVSCDVMVYVNGGTMPTASALSLQHQCYFTFTNFYTGSDGNKTLAAYKSAYGTQDSDAVISLTSDPLFVGGGDYRLQAGSPARNIGTDPGTAGTVHAGCYLTGSETIGVAA